MGGAQIVVGGAVMMRNRMYRPENVSIPKRFSEITTWKGLIDTVFMANLQDEYGRRTTELAV